jgi:hypothetical protein
MAFVCGRVDSTATRERGFLLDRAHGCRSPVLACLHTQPRYTCILKILARASTTQQSSSRQVHTKFSIQKPARGGYTLVLVSMHDIVFSTSP